MRGQHRRHAKPTPSSSPAPWANSSAAPASPSRSADSSTTTRCTSRRSSAPAPAASTGSSSTRPGDSAAARSSSSVRGCARTTAPRAASPTTTTAPCSARGSRRCFAVPDHRRRASRAASSTAAPGRSAPVGDVVARPAFAGRRGAVDRAARPRRGASDGSRADAGLGRRHPLRCAAPPARSSARATRNCGASPRACEDAALRERLAKLERRLAALSRRGRRASGPTLDVRLSPRETDVLACAALGATNAEIAATLYAEGGDGEVLPAVGDGEAGCLHPPRGGGQGAPRRPSALRRRRRVLTLRRPSEFRFRSDDPADILRHSADLPTFGGCSHRLRSHCRRSTQRRSVWSEMILLSADLRQ